MKRLIAVFGVWVSVAAQAVTVSTVAELKAAVSGAKDGDEIVVSAAGSPYVLDATLSTYKKITLRGDSSDPRAVVLDGNRTGNRGIYLTAEGCTVQSLTVSNVLYAQSGAGCYLGKSAWVENCVFTVCTNTASGCRGGGLLIESGTVTNCLFQANGSTVAGGGAFCATAGGNAYLTKCVFLDNYAAAAGGAIYHNANLDNCKIYLTDCAFTNNVAKDGGCLRGRFEIRRCDFAGNRATDAGGVVYSNSTPANNAIYDSYFTNNVAGSNGGALNLSTANWTISNCTFVANEASKAGGAISSSGSGQKMFNCRYYANRAKNGGGGASDGSFQIVRDCVFVDNRATKRGGSLSDPASGLTNWIVNVSITNSISEGGGDSNYGGGAVYGGAGSGTFTIVSNLTIFGATCTMGYGGAFMTRAPTAIYDSRFLHCTNTFSNAYGGAINTESSLLLVDCTFDDCVAKNTRGGGAVGANAGTTIMTNCTFRNCYSTTDGGAVYVAGAGGASGCVFANNWSRRNGGGYFGKATCAGGLVDCVFSENISSNGGNSALTNMRGAGFYSDGAEAVVDRCTFVSNTCFGSHGGGICVGGGTLSVVDSTFFANKQLRPDRTTKTDHGGSGGGIGVNGGNLVLVDRCKFVENVADAAGGGIGNYHSGKCSVHSDIRNSLFLRNATDDCTMTGCSNERAGGGVALNSTNITVSCCTFVSNVCYTTANGGGICGKNSETGVPLVENCLLWDNIANGATAGGNTANRYRSTRYFFNYDSQGYLPTANGNLGPTDVAAPGFVDAAADDYRLAGGSALIDAGRNADWMETATYLDPPKRSRSGRLYNGIVDIGCYEYWPVPGILLMVR